MTLLMMWWILLLDYMILLLMLWVLLLMTWSYCWCCWSCYWLFDPLATVWILLLMSWPYCWWENPGSVKKNPSTSRYLFPNQYWVLNATSCWKTKYFIGIKEHSTTFNLGGFNFIGIPTISDILSHYSCYQNSVSSSRDCRNSWLGYSWVEHYKRFLCKSIFCC
jgi:hypothetical protein